MDGSAPRTDWKRCQIIGRNYITCVPDVNVNAPSKADALL
jgi:hypothetical protein